MVVQVAESQYFCIAKDVLVQTLEKVSAALLERPAQKDSLPPSTFQHPELPAVAMLHSQHLT